MIAHSYGSLARADALASAQCAFAWTHALASREPCSSHGGDQDHIGWYCLLTVAGSSRPPAPSIRPARGLAASIWCDSGGRNRTALCGVLSVQPRGACCVLEALVSFCQQSRERACFLDEPLPAV